MDFDGYDRRQVKRAAREALRRTRPKPTLVAFLYFLLAGLLPVLVPLLPELLTPAYRPAGFRTGGGFRPAEAPNAALLTVFLLILMGLFALILGVGYVRYAMQVRRGRPAGVGDLFSGFSCAGLALRTNLLVGLFSVLWLLPGMAVISALVLSFGATGSRAFVSMILFVGYLGLIAYTLNRTLRYQFVNYLLWDRPELGALGCITESKRLMKGRRWSCCVLSLSFAGWYLLLLVPLYAVTFLAALFGGGDESAILVGMVLGMLAACPVWLWLLSYVSISMAGFYDAGAGMEPVLPAQEPWRQAPPVLPTYIPPVERSPESEPGPPPAPAPTPWPLPTPEPEDGDDEPEL